MVRLTVNKAERMSISQLGVVSIEKSVADTSDMRFQGLLSQHTQLHFK